MSADSRRLKGFMLAALVWLPLAFLGWAVLGPWLVYLPGWISGWLLSELWPMLFSGSTHSGVDWQAVTSIMVREPASGVFGQLIFELQPMTYGYSLPLFVALVMATQLTPGQRARQCLIALPILWLAQIFGIVSGALKLVQFDAGPSGLAAAEAAGLSADAVALAYQFGRLILPAVVPVVLWVVLNRGFLDSLGSRATARFETEE